MVFKSHKIFKQLFRSVEFKTNPFFSQEVYKITIHIRNLILDKHVDQFKPVSKNTSLIPIIIELTNLQLLNSFKSKHHICFDQTKILASTSHYSSRLIREASEIEKHHNNFNREGGYKLSQSLIPHWFIQYFFFLIFSYLVHTRFLLN